jgi:hypothetical protein
MKAAIVLASLVPVLASIAACSAAPPEGASTEQQDLITINPGVLRSLYPFKPCATFGAWVVQVPVESAAACPQITVQGRTWRGMPGYLWLRESYDAFIKANPGTTIADWEGYMNANAFQYLPFHPIPVGPSTTSLFMPPTPNDNFCEYEETSAYWTDSEFHGADLESPLLNNGTISEVCGKPIYCDYLAHINCMPC